MRVMEAMLAQATDGSVGGRAAFKRRRERLMHPAFFGVLLAAATVGQQCVPSATRGPCVESIQYLPAGARSDQTSGVLTSGADLDETAVIGASAVCAQGLDLETSVVGATRVNTRGSDSGENGVAGATAITSRGSDLTDSGFIGACVASTQGVGLSEIGVVGEIVFITQGLDLDSMGVVGAATAFADSPDSDDWNVVCALAAYSRAGFGRHRRSRRSHAIHSMP